MTNVRCLFPKDWLSIGWLLLTSKKMKNRTHKTNEKNSIYLYSFVVKMFFFRFVSFRFVSFPLALLQSHKSNHLMMKLVARNICIVCISLEKSNFMWLKSLKRKLKVNKQINTFWRFLLRMVSWQDPLRFSSDWNEKLFQCTVWINSKSSCIRLILVMTYEPLAQSSEEDQRCVMLNEKEEEKKKQNQYPSLFHHPKAIEPLFFFNFL